jgi:hypothetical protein
LCLFIQEHTLKQNRGKKKVPSWELLNFQCNEWNRRKRRGGEIKIEWEIWDEKRWRIFHSKNKSKKYTRKYFTSLLLMKIHSREMRLKKYHCKKKHSKKKKFQIPSLQLLFNAMDETEILRKGRNKIDTESRNLLVCFVLFVIWDLPYHSPHCNLGTVEKPSTSKGVHRGGFLMSQWDNARVIEDWTILSKTIQQRSKLNI